MRALRVVLAAAAATLAVPAALADATPTGRAATTASVKIVDFAFRPAYTPIEPGDTVVWSQTSPDVHTVTSRAGAPESFDSQDLQPDATFSRAFPRPGRYAYHCTIHPFMRGVVQVGPDTIDPKLAKPKAKVGKQSVKVSFRLSEAARVSATVVSAKKPSKVLRRAKAKQLQDGSRAVSIKTKGLAPGRYRAVVTAKDPAANSGVAKVPFAIPAPR